MKKIISIILTIAIVLPCFCVNTSAQSAFLDSRYETKMRQVTEMLMNDKITLDKVAKLDRCVVYISVSDTSQQAVTVTASTKKLEASLDKALAKARATDINPVWFKLDVVTEVEAMTYESFKTTYKESLNSAMRKGIAFNDYFGRSLLEAQINSNGWLDYTTGELDLEAINKYFKKNKLKQLPEIPETIYLFRSKGFFADNSGQVIRLTSGNYAQFGTRPYEMTKDDIVNLAKRSSHYLVKMCGEDGKFVYGYYPIDNEELEGYNIIRHAGTVWNLILQYEMTGDRYLLKPIERALGYLQEYIHYKDKNTAFLNDRGTLNVGGNGISLLAFVSYAEIMKSDKYNDLIKALANGIMYLQKDNGAFVHTINKSDYSVYKDYITVFYDGEATYGILRAYGLLGNKKYLKTAEKAADYFIANGYETLNSHWISYSFNELTKYSPKEEYFNFGLKNVHGYTERVNRTVTAAHTTCETMGSSFELYHRMLSSGKTCDMMKEFDGDLLVEAFQKRATWGMHYFIQPEQAMYFSNPRLVLYSHVVREDNFRIRIDDIQHFMGGYYLYWKNYETVQEYLNKEAPQT